MSYHNNRTLLHLQRVKIRCCSLRSNQNTNGMPGINILEWLHKQHFSNTSLVAREPDGSSPVWQTQDVPWLLRSGRDYLSIGKEWGCQAPEVLWAVRSARKNDAIANKFTWPSSVSGGQAGECLSVRQWPPAFSPEILGGKRKMLTDHFKDCAGPPWRSSFYSTSGHSSPGRGFALCKSNTCWQRAALVWTAYREDWMKLSSLPNPTRAPWD